MKTRCGKYAVLLHLNIFKDLQVQVLDMLRAYLARGALDLCLDLPNVYKKVILRMLSGHMRPYMCVSMDLANASKEWPDLIHNTYSRVKRSIPV